MEKKIKISASDGKKIYGVLNGFLNSPLIVFVHGLTGFLDEHQFFNAASFFTKHGFACFRFNLYDGAKDARKLEECTLETHASDLDRVIKYFRKGGVKKIFVVGHSYGGKTVLASKDKDFNGVVLWDPSHRSSGLFDKAEYIKELDVYLLSWAYRVLIGKKMVADEKESKTEEKISEIKVPIKIICAGKGVLIKGGKWYYQRANQPKNFSVIKKATHCFGEEGVEKKLFEETLSWIKKI